MNPAEPRLLFNVENPGEWLAVYFDYDEQRTWGEMRIYDPRGKLRFSYMNVHSPRHVLIHRSRELTGYLGVPGDIEAGAWRVEFTRVPPRKFILEWEVGCGPSYLAHLLPSASRDYWTDGCPTQKDFSLNLYDWQACLEVGRRWYKGDTHGHTVLSDGKMTPEQTMEQARKMELDFLFTTEHNLLPCSWPSSSRTLVIPGMELTSFGRGDWNALGLTRWVDGWGADLGTGGAWNDGGMRTSEGQLRLMREVGALGAIRNINHPLHGHFAWLYPELPLDCIDTLEIWNSPTRSNRPELTERTLKLWDVLWNEGYRIPGLGGSDAHLPPTESYEEGGEKVTIGDPATCVYAERLSPNAIIQGIKAGHVYVSRGPVLDVQFSCGGQDFTCGDDLTVGLDRDEKREVVCRLSVSGAAHCKLVVIENGVQAEMIELDAGEQQVIEMAFSWGERVYRWRRFEIRADDGRLLAFTNPVSYGTTKPSISTWQDLLSKGAT